MSRAAGLHGVTPSAASQHLHELEKTLEAQLLDRSSRPITLTPSGHLFHDMCRDILRRQEEFSAALDELRGEVQGRVRVASIYSIGLSEMPQLEAEFQKRLPEVRLQVEYLRPERVYEAVSADRVDIGLVSYPEPSKEIAVRPWRTEKMVVIASPGHPLTRKREVSASDLSDMEFIAFDGDLPIRRELDRWLRSQGVEVKIVMQFDNLQTMKEAVVMGSGVSIVPASILRAELLEGRLVAIPIAAPSPVRPLGILHRKKKRFQRAEQAFLDLLQEARQ